jgi:hypothetical protein
MPFRSQILIPIIFATSFIYSSVALLLVPLIFFARYDQRELFSIMAVVLIVFLFRIWPYIYTDCLPDNPIFCRGMSANYLGAIFLYFQVAMCAVLFKDKKIATATLGVYVLIIFFIVSYTFYINPIELGFRKIIIPFMAAEPVNANTIITSASLAAILFYAYKGKSILPIIFLFTVAVATQNRSGMLGVLFCSLLHISNAFKDFGYARVITNLVLSIGASLATLIIIYLSFSDNNSVSSYYDTANSYYEGAMSRVFLVNAFTDGRFEHYNEYFANIDLYSFLIGGVLNNLSPSGFHNFYLDSLANYGFLSIIANTFLIFILISNAVKSKSNVLVIVFFVFVSLTSNVFLGFNAETILFLHFVQREFYKAFSSRVSSTGFYKVCA